MTREDCLSRKAVLDTLDTTDKFLDEDRTVENYKALLKECYEVLTPVTPPSDDCVSRKSLLDKLDPLYKEKIKTAPDNMAEGFLQVSNLIKYEPPVTPTRKKGKWLTTSDFPDRLICSCCNTNYDMWFWEQGTMNYCPNCGAEMESEE